MWYDFKCDNGHVTEREFLMSEVPETIPCPAPQSMIYCDLLAWRQLARPAALLTYLSEKGMDPPSKRWRPH